MNLPNEIILKADEKTVQKSIITTWGLIFAITIGGVIYVNTSLSGGGNVIGKAISCLLVTGLFIWLISTLLSVNRKQKRQIRDGTILYQLTVNGITIGDGTNYAWSDFKKIYYYKASVQLLEKGKIINGVVLSPSGIEAKAFKRACLFIKEHAPPEITKSFEPR